MAAKNSSFSFADKLYQSFKKHKKTALSLHELSATFKSKYGRDLDRSELRQLAFLRFKRDVNNEWIIYLILESDDCCVDKKACTITKCPLLHSYKSSDKFQIIYPFTTSPKKQNNLRLPDICLQDRLCFILNECTSKPKQLSMQQIIKRHNELYPTLKAHEPSPEGIFIRFKSTFFVHYDEAIGDKVISYSNTLNLVPDQLNRKYLAINLSDKWMDSSLIRDLVRHISQNTGKHVHDIYIGDTLNLGYFVLKNRAIAQKFVSNAKKGKIKCRGRTVHAIMVQQQGPQFQIKTRNLNALISAKEFDDWVFSQTHTKNKKHLVTKITLVHPKRQNKCTQCIVVLPKNVDTQFVINKLRNTKFRKTKLVIKHWKHPHDTQPKARNVLKPKPKIPSIQSPTSSSSCAIITQAKVRNAAKAKSKMNSNNPSIRSPTSSSSCVITSNYKQEETYTKGKSVSIGEGSTSSASSSSSSSCDYVSADKNGANSEQTNSRKIWMNMLNGISTETFHTLLSETVNLILLCRTKEDVDDIFGCLLQFAVANVSKTAQYIVLLKHLLAYCHQFNSDLMNADVFIQTTQHQISGLFIKYNENKRYDKQRFICIVQLAAELYVVRICSIHFVCNRILNVILSEKCVTVTDIHAICQLFKICGKCMDDENKQTLDRYFQSIGSHAMHFGDKMLIKTVENLKRMRQNAWNCVAAGGSNILQQKYMKLQQEYNELINVHKTLQNQHNELQIKYEKLEKEKNENKNYSSDYLMWSAKDIALWIVHLDQAQYAKYYEILIKSMHAEGIDGKCLANIDKNDLHRLGVTHFKHKHEIFKHIEQLIENKNAFKLAKKCIVCTEKAAVFACAPCGHLCLCQRCCKEININSECPVCQTQCRSLFRIFL